ncbi:MAG: class I SAM-dependent methyltransferase [Patescibacteria group bacterium]
MYKLIIRILVWIHNFSYRLIGILVIKENGGIHPKHKILNYYEFFLNNISSSDKILDIGCGNGACTNAVAKKVAKVVGIDISKNNIKMAKERFSNENLEYIVGDATAYEFKENFDVIVLSNVLEHIENRQNFLEKIKKLAPKILIRVPLLTRDWLAIYEKEKGLEYRLDKTHFIEYSEESFRDEINKAGLKIESFYVKFGELYSIIKINLNAGL